MQNVLRKGILAFCVSTPILMQSIPVQSAPLHTAPKYYSIEEQTSIIDWSHIIAKHVSRGLSYDEAIELCTRLATLYGNVLRPEAQQAGYKSITIYLDRKTNIGLSFPC
ncbi:MAG: hypothetical protein AB7L92_05415 [Alphaproteobacteria bacterium]